MPPDSAAVSLRGVSVRYGDVPALDDIWASIPPRSCTILIGPNGGGKTTLLRVLLGDVRYSGVVSFAPGHKGEKPRIGYVPQRVRIDPGLPLTVLEFLAMGLQRRPLWLGVSAAARFQAVSFLRRVQADHLASRRLGALSGGEMQRVLLALSLQQEPDILLLDEPSAGMDPQGDLLFCALLEELRHKHAFTQIMVSHDLGLAAHHATHLLCLKRSLLAEGPPEAVFTDQMLRGLFGVHKGLLTLPLSGETISAKDCAC